MITDLENVCVGDVVVVRRHINNTKFVDTVDHIWYKNVLHRTEDKIIHTLKVITLSHTGLDINTETGVEIDMYNKPHFSIV